MIDLAPLFLGGILDGLLTGVDLRGRIMLALSIGLGGWYMVKFLKIGQTVGGILAKWVFIGAVVSGIIAVAVAAGWISIMQGRILAFGEWAVGGIANAVSKWGDDLVRTIIGGAG